MEALAAPELPQGPEWQYEPKWDGFRCLAQRLDDTIRAAIEIRPAAGALYSGHCRRRGGCFTFW